MAHFGVYMTLVKVRGGGVVDYSSMLCHYYSMSLLILVASSIENIGSGVVKFLGIAKFSNW